MSGCRVSKVTFKPGRAPYTGFLVRHYVRARSGRGYVFDSYWKLVGTGQYQRLSTLEYVRSIR